MLLTIVVLFAAPPLSAEDNAALEIVRRCMTKDQTNWQQARNYTYLRRSEEKELDNNGGVKSTETKTVDVSILYGERYRRLVRKNDKPLDPGDEEKEQAKLNKFVQERQNESEQEKAKRLAKVERERQKQREFLREVPDAFVFKQLADEVIDGRPVFVIEGTPKPGYTPQLDEAKILKRVRARFWIDKSEYQWIKAEAEILDTVSFGLFLVRVEKGSRFEFEQARINNEIWLPKHQHQVMYGRLGLIKRVHVDVDSVETSYKKFTANSKIVSIDAK